MSSSTRLRRAYSASFTRSAAATSGTDSYSMRSSFWLAKSAKSSGSLVSDTLLDAVRLAIFTSSTRSVRMRAVSSSCTRIITKAFKLPRIFLAFARSPMRASTSAQVWVYAVTS